MKWSNHLTLWSVCQRVLPADCARKPFCKWRSTLATIRPHTWSRLLRGIFITAVTWKPRKKWCQAVQTCSFRPQRENSPPSHWLRSVKLTNQTNEWSASLSIQIPTRQPMRGKNFTALSTRQVPLKLAFLLVFRKNGCNVVIFRS